MPNQYSLLGEVNFSIMLVRSSSYWNLPMAVAMKVKITMAKKTKAITTADLFFMKFWKTARQ